jgi:GNAT superfamily N-acetyltransferase
VAVTVRATVESEFEAAAALVRATLPGRDDTAEAWRRGDTRAGTPAQRLVAVEEAVGVIGYGASWRVRSDKERLDLAVRPDHHRRGAGGRLLAALEAGMRGTGAATVQARADVGARETLTFLEHRGFVETQRMAEQRLDVIGADLSALPRHRERLRAAGIAVITLEEAERDPDCWQGLADLDNAVAPDWPDPDPGPIEPVTAEQAQRRYADPTILRNGFFLAVRGRRFLGYSGLTVTGKPGELASAGTATRPEARGHGLATALKLLCTEFARRHGCAGIITHSANPRMVRINERLGFRPGRVEVRLVKNLAAGIPARR